MNLIEFNYYNYQNICVPKKTEKIEEDKAKDPLTQNYMIPEGRKLESKGAKFEH